MLRRRIAKAECCSVTEFTAASKCVRQRLTCFASKCTVLLSGVLLNQNPEKLLSNSNREIHDSYVQDSKSEVLLALVRDNVKTNNVKTKSTSCVTKSKKVQDALGELTKGEPTPFKTSSIERVLDIDRPISDKRLYRFITLPNKMDVLLVSDPNCNNAACALTVEVGSIFDPPELQGMAHFCEHMLFLGTEKYPNEHEYKNFVEQHGGNMNATTYMDKTSYYFSITPEHLEGGIDRFAQFFISPKFTESATNRELEAVNSEFELSRFNDTRIAQQLLRHLANPKHPLHGFGFGNSESLKTRPQKLGINLRQAVLDFYRKYYSSNIMKLCVIGKESLDDLEKMVCKNRFELVKNNNVKIPKEDKIGGSEVPFRNEDLCKQIKVVIPKNLRLLSLIWMLPELTRKWETKPLLYINYLLNHHGDGSLVSALRKESLALELVSSVNQQGSGVLAFGVNILLTDKGATEAGRKRIAEIVHQYLRLIKESPIQEQIVSEVERINEMEFKFKNNEGSLDHALALSQNMQLFPPQRLLSAPYLTFKRDTKQIEELLKSFRPERLFVVFTAGANQMGEDTNCWEMEPYFQTRYKIEPLDKKTIDILANAEEQKPVVHFPALNPFIPETFELKPRPLPKEKMPNFPQLLKVQTPHMKTRLYYKQDNVFDLPRATIKLRFSCDAFRKNLKSLLIGQLYIGTVAQSLNDFLYYAGLGGFFYMISLGNYGFTMEIWGYDDKLKVLLEELCKNLTNPKLTPEAFQITKETLVSALKLQCHNLPLFNQVHNLRERYILPNIYTPSEKLAVAEELKYEDICGVVAAPQEKLLEGASVDGLVLGNYLEDEAKELLNIADRSLFGSTKVQNNNQPKPFQIVDLRDQSGKLIRLRVCDKALNPLETNSASALMIQMGHQSIKDEILAQMADTLLNTLFFNELRTKQQVGYSLLAFMGRTSHINELHFVAGSCGLKPKDITERIEAFLEEVLNHPEKYISEEEFDKTRMSLIGAFEKKAKNLLEEEEGFFFEIGLRRYQFERRERKARLLQTVTRDQLFNFLKSLPKLPWMLVEIEGNKDPIATDTKEKTEVSSFPTKPSMPIKWEDIEKDTKEYFSTRVKSYYDIPIPGTQLPRPVNE